MKFILLIVMILFAIYSIKILKYGRLSGFLLLLLSIISSWFIIMPKDLNIIANLLGVGRGADLLLYISVSFGVVLWITMHSAMRRQDIILTKLIREIAILNYENKNG